MIQRQGADRILVQVPGLQDPTRLKELLGKTAKLDFRMVDTTVRSSRRGRAAPPPDAEILYGTGKERPALSDQKRFWCRATT